MVLPLKAQQALGRSPAPLLPAAGKSWLRRLPGLAWPQTRHSRIHETYIFIYFITFYYTQYPRSRERRTFELSLFINVSARAKGDPSRGVPKLVEVKMMMADEIVLEVDGAKELFTSVWVHLQDVREPSVRFKVRVPEESANAVFDPYGRRAADDPWAKFIGETVAGLGAFIVEAYFRSMAKATGQHKSNYRGNSNHR